MTKQRLCCGRFFTPDKRVSTRQKVCRKEECRKSLKAKSQKAWKEKNPGYSKNHYRDYIVPWRQRKRGDPVSSRIDEKTPEKIKDEKAGRVIRDEISSSNPLLELVLVIPASAAGMIKDEIRLRKVDSYRFAAYAQSWGSGLASPLFLFNPFHNLTHGGNWCQFRFSPLITTSYTSFFFGLPRLPFLNLAFIDSSTF